MRQLVRKMIRKLIIPFCFFFFIGYFYHIIISQNISLGKLATSVKGIFLGKNIVVNDILWFLLVLFNVRILGNIIIQKQKYFYLSLVFVLTICIIYKINWFYIGSSLMALPFYLFGYHQRSSIYHINNTKYPFITIVLLIIATVTITQINGRVSMSSFRFGHSDYLLLNICLFYINGIIGSFLLLYIGTIIKQTVFFQTVCRCAISILGLQYIPIMIWFRVQGFNHQEYLLSFFYSLVIIIICIGFHFFCVEKVKWLSFS